MKRALLMCAAIMLAGCSEEKSTGDPKIDQALKDAVHFDSLGLGRDGRFYQNKEPYSGWAIRTDRWGVAALLQFKDGKWEGLWTDWHENGQKKGEATFKNGKMDGLQTMWRENGQKWYEATYKDGELDGLMTQWHENGQKKGEATFKDGEPDGLWTEWHKNRQKQREVIYKDGEEVSAKYWNSKGEEVESLDEAKK